MACCAIAIYLIGQLCEGMTRFLRIAGIRLPRRPAVHSAAAWRLTDADPA
ncbi:MAG: hypothetical protein M0R03_10310 [Novosphingobium sp.]|nr:hypothetical protein [Novosphingobium sp.]